MLRTAADCHVRSRSVRHDIHISVLLLSLFGSKSCFGSKAFLFVSGDVAWIIKRVCRDRSLFKWDHSKADRGLLRGLLLRHAHIFPKSGAHPAPADLLKYEQARSPLTQTSSL